MCALGYSSDVKGGQTARVDIFDPHKLDATLSAVGREQAYSADVPIFFQGEPAKHIAYVLSGTATANAYSRDGEQTWLGQFKAGDFIGHTAFLSDAAMRFDVSAQTDLRLRMISVSQLQGLLDDHADLGQALSRDLAQRLDVMMTRLIEALTLSAKGRVCAELVRLSVPIGIDPGRWVVRPNPVFVDMAMRVNSTRETVSRTVNGLQKRGIISREAGALIINNPDALKSAIQ